MTEYFATTNISDCDDIVDFINYVFSYTSCPHDFKLLYPNVYSEKLKQLGAVHYVVKEDGKIKGVAADKIIDCDVCGQNIKLGIIGSVCVHPYSRGKGYMKALMNNSIEDAKNRNVDIMVLDGQRQRYGYFGFENAGSKLSFRITNNNIRHALKDVDTSDISFCEISEDTPDYIDFAKSLYDSRPFHSVRSREEFLGIMHTFRAKFTAILKGGKMTGYLFGELKELVLADEKDFPAVLKAIFTTYGYTDKDIVTSNFEKERAEFLAQICESSKMLPVEKILVLNWESTLRAFLTLKGKTAPLEDGKVCVSIDGKCFGICVENGVVSVTLLKEEKDAIKLTHGEAVTKFFGMNNLLYPDKALKNWVPFPFIIDAPDYF